MRQETEIKEEISRLENYIKENGHISHAGEVSLARAYIEALRWVLGITSNQHKLFIEKERKNV